MLQLDAITSQFQNIFLAHAIVLKGNIVTTFYVMVLNWFIDISQYSELSSAEILFFSWCLYKKILCRYWNIRMNNMDYHQECVFIKLPSIYVKALQILYSLYSDFIFIIYLPQCNQYLCCLKKQATLLLFDI